MAFNRINLEAPQVPNIERAAATLGNLGNVYSDAKLRQGRENAMMSYQKGVPLSDLAANLAQAGDMEGALKVTAAAEAQKARAEASGRAGASLAEMQRHHKASEEIARQQFQEGKLPPGTIPDPNVPGGIMSRPGFIEHQQRLMEAKEKPRQFNVSDIAKLSEEGGKFAQVSGFVDTFKPDYAGYKSQAVGNAVNYAGRYLPEGAVGANVAESSKWWQGYDRYKNVIRNDLYGSALTTNEQAAFEKADVNPGMDPKAIANNLRIQKEVVQNGLKRKANALITSGYDPEPVAAAYGVDLKGIGVTASGKGGKGDKLTITPEEAQAELARRAAGRQ